MEGKVSGPSPEGALTRIEPSNHGSLAAEAKGARGIRASRASFLATQVLSGQGAHGECRKKFNAQTLLEVGTRPS